ncbi:MAG TPA: hypothetical protein VFR67_04460 [Pilimelia sp.]|nr:hypothetical protein [Pilimelia sp.]
MGQEYAPVTGFTGSPRAARGALVGVDPMNPLASLVVFQYNPDEMTRTLQARAPGGAGAAGGARNEALRLSGAPIENITLTVEIDAADQLANGDPLAAALGIYPQLSSLEMLLYPKSAVVIANTVLALAGTIELIPAEAPLTLLIWGVKRVVPVRLTQFSITEQAYDTGLNPIRAKVALGLRVLSYSDLSLSNPGYYVFLAHQVTKEVMATIGSVSAIATAGAGVTGSLSLGV